MRVYLEDIVIKKRERVLARGYDLEALKIAVKELPKRPSFYKALKKEGLSIIGEIKKASPSKGLIRADFEPVELAKKYEHVVDAVSVLTEEDYFLGKDAYLKAVSDSISLPTLCKDFIVDPAQIYEAKKLGASCILLITAILSDEELRTFRDLSVSLDMDALVEVHTKEEMERALKIEPNIIGINNRNLKTFEIDLNTTIELSKMVPKGTCLVSESGIFCEQEIKILNKTAYDAILVGESFMRTDDIEEHARVLKDAYKGTHKSELLD